MAPSNTQGALILSQRRPATKVVVFQWAPRYFADQPPAPVAAASGPRHFGICSGLIDEDELACIKSGLVSFPLLTCLSDVGPILFGGAQRFF
jgi:hypothetical protein